MVEAAEKAVGGEVYHFHTKLMLKGNWQQNIECRVYMLKLHTNQQYGTTAGWTMVLECSA